MGLRPHFLVASQVMPILLLWEAPFETWALPACLGPPTVCGFSQLEALNSHVLILPHAGKKEYRPFIGSVGRNFTT